MRVAKAITAGMQAQRRADWNRLAWDLNDDWRYAMQAWLMWRWPIQKCPPTHCAP